MRDCVQTSLLNRHTRKSAQLRNNSNRNTAKTWTPWISQLCPQQEFMVGNVRSALVMILVAVGFLLLVACANVANLLLAQATTRQRDFAVRSALGATRLRLARQFITENVLLVLIAGALGVVISFWGVDLLLGLNQQSLPRINEIGVNTRVVAFTLGLVVVDWSGARPCAFASLLNRES